MLLTSEQRAASLDCTLARRPDNSPVWIFGYGSLMWNPVFDSEEARPATLRGYHRAFCLRLTSGRGTHAQPGRMLALRDGGQTTGLAFRLPEDKLHEELELLWKLELVREQEVEKEQQPGLELVQEQKVVVMMELKLEVMQELEVVQE